MALSNALAIALKLALSIQLEEMMSFPKLAKAYYALLEVLCNNHATTIAELETPVFVQIILSLQEGLKSLDGGICSQACSALDHILTYFYHQGRKDSPASRAMARHVGEHPELFPRVLDHLLRLVLFEDCSNQWSISRPMLGLILTNQKYFVELKNQLVNSQPMERRERLMSVFNKLMEEVQENMEQKNRDKFTQNLTLFRHEVKSFVTP